METWTVAGIFNGAAREGITRKMFESKGESSEGQILVLSMKALSP